MASDNRIEHVVVRGRGNCGKRRERRWRMGMIVVLCVLGWLLWERHC